MNYKEKIEKNIELIGRLAFEQLKKANETNFQYDLIKVLKMMNNKGE